jgi:hypothetical protein
MRKAAQQFESATVDSAQYSEGSFNLKLQVPVIGTCHRQKGRKFCARFTVMFFQNFKIAKLLQLKLFF